jgi:type IX secretion system PorP/SprF family membrane protein
MIKIIYSYRLFANTRNIFLATLLWLSFLNIVNAQDFPLHTQYMYNKSFINPGALGVKAKIGLLLMHRSQWVGIEGAPMTSDLSFEYPLQKAAFGLDLIQDQNGPLSKYTGNLKFSYDLELSFTTYLSLGVNVGVYNNQFNINKLKIRDQGEDLFANSVDEINYDVGVGAFFYSETWYLGLSTTNLNMQKYYPKLTDQYDKRLLHAYLMGGYNFEVNRDITLQPSILVRYINGLPISADLSVNMQWNETLITGLAYRLNSAYSLLLGMNISRQLHIGYAFDWDQNKIYMENYGSHELFLRYYISRDENSLRYQNPRFF